MYAKDLNVHGSMALLLKDALKPNLVQTSENTAAIVHGGPFANIAHGTNSIVATKIAQKLSEYVVVEAGFGSDLGAEKFINIVARKSGIYPQAAVLVVTVKALKHHAKIEENSGLQSGVNSIQQGLENLEKHIENLKVMGLETVVALNKFPDDKDEEIELIRSFCEEMGVEFQYQVHILTGQKVCLSLLKRL